MNTLLPLMNTTVSLNSGTIITVLLIIALILVILYFARRV